MNPFITPSTSPEDAPPDLNDGSWGIFYTPGMSVLGRDTGGGAARVRAKGAPAYYRVEHPFEYVAQTTISPQGVNRPRYLFPFEFMTEVKSVEVVPYMVAWLSEWGDDDRASIMQGIVKSLKVLDGIKRSRSPIAIAPAGSVPPFNGRA